jgi:hypothetical protein
MQERRATSAAAAAAVPAAAVPAAEATAVAPQAAAVSPAQCPQCHAAVGGQDQFCGDCGYRLR